MTTQPRWDIFCAVVDNYGDIGVCWRLARQLAGEFGYVVRLWVDDLRAFQRLYPALDCRLERQTARGVEIRRWAAPFPAVSPADVVVEAFGCPIPEVYVAAMAGCTPKPTWINLEYLSAEDWVAGCHGLPSPHPRLALVKHFFFPGFTPASGGVLCESDLPTARRLFQDSRETQAAWWAGLGMADLDGDALKVSLFCYANPGLSGLLAAWAESPVPLVCLAPSGAVGDALAAFFGASQAAPGDIYRRGNLTARIFPFLDQEQYDRLLWACDCNFVRGEDSFVRAQWAARPLVWQIYPQQEDAHFPKLDAFMKCYGATLPSPAALALRELWLAWNGVGEIAPAWRHFYAELAALKSHAQGWADDQEKIGGLAANLVKFCNNMIK